MDEILLENGKKIIGGGCDLYPIHEKTVLITGASGLFGVHFLYSILALKLEKEIGPKKIYAVHHSKLPEYLEDLQEVLPVEFIQGDLSDFNFCRRLAQADIIVHAATYGQPGKFLNDQITTFQLNTSTTIELLNKLNTGGRFLFASSCAVYTGCQSSFFSETDIGCTNTDHPRICYIEGKRAGEAICNIYRECNGVHAVSLRISYTYGPGVQKGDARAMYQFIEKGMEGDICLLDQGKAVHTYCYITDAMVIAWNALLYGKRSVYNLAGNSEVSIYGLASMIGKIMGRKVLLPEKEEGVTGAQVLERTDISRAEKEFGKREFVGLEEGLRKTVEWYGRKNKNGKNGVDK